MDDRVAILVQVMSAFGRRYADAPDGLLETIFLPVIEHFTERCDARWINIVWFLPQKHSPLVTLTAGQTDIVLRSLVHLRRIESHAERVLGLMAKASRRRCSISSASGWPMRHLHGRDEGRRGAANWARHQESHSGNFWANFQLGLGRCR